MAGCGAIVRRSIIRAAEDRYGRVPVTTECVIGHTGAKEVHYWLFNLKMYQMTLNPAWHGDQIAFWRFFYSSHLEIMV